MGNPTEILSEAEEKYGKLKTAVRWADYKGIVDASLGSLRGPNTLGEYMAVVEVRHNYEDQTTCIGFAFAGSGDPDVYRKRYVDSHRVLAEAVSNNSSGA